MSSTQEKTHEKTSQHSKNNELDKSSREKLNTALNYYFYSIGSNKEICNNFDLIKEDQYIKDHVDNIEILSCLYNPKHPHELIKSILDHLKKSPDDIVKILKKDREAGLKKNEQKVKTITNNYQNEKTRLEKELNNTEDEIKQALKALDDLNKAIDALEKKRDKLKHEINNSDRTHENQIVEIERDDISIKEDNIKGYKALRNYEDVGHELNELSIQLEKIESHRRKPNGQKYTLNPKKTCRGEYELDKHDKSRCICRVDDNNYQICDSHNCRNLPGFIENQQCKSRKQKQN